MNYSIIPISLFAVLLLITINVLSANADGCTQVCVAKKFYQQGDTVVISGKVNAILEKTPITLEIINNSTSTIVRIDQIDVSQDGTYTYTFIVDGKYWKTNGNYIVKAVYGVSTNVYETSFDFQTKEKATETSQTFEVKAGDSGTFDVPYTIHGGTIKDIIVDPQSLGFIVKIQADGDGAVTLDLGRKWIDAKTSTGTDDTFIIYVDGSEVQYQESSTDTDSRVLTIQFQEGDSDIEIIGTQVIPEFGPIATIVLIVAITATIAISTKRISQIRIN